MIYIKLASKESCDIIYIIIHADIAIRGFAFPDCYTRVYLGFRLV